MRAALALVLVCTSAGAREPSCPRILDGPGTPALMAGAIRLGPAEDRVELAGGDLAKTRNGYEIVYQFPGHEPKWLMCAYGKDGKIQRFQALSERATKCTLRVRESAPAVTVQVTCK